MGALVVALVAAGCGSREPETANVVGSIEVQGRAQVEIPRQSGPCYVKDGYDDVREGVSVVIRDGKGEVVALTPLWAPVVTFTSGVESPYDYKCRFNFIAEGVPKGHDFYSVEVGHRGQVNFDEAGLFGRGPHLTLG